MVNNNWVRWSICFKVNWPTYLCQSNMLLVTRWKRISCMFHQMNWPNSLWEEIDFRWVNYVTSYRCLAQSVFTKPLTWERLWGFGRLLTCTRRCRGSMFWSANTWAAVLDIKQLTLTLCLWITAVLQHSAEQSKSRVWSPSLNLQFDRRPVGQHCSQSHSLHVAENARGNRTK